MFKLLKIKKLASIFTELFLCLGKGFILFQDNIYASYIFPLWRKNFGIVPRIRMREI